MMGLLLRKVCLMKKSILLSVALLVVGQLSAAADKCSENLTLKKEIVYDYGAEDRQSLYRMDEDTSKPGAFIQIFPYSDIAKKPYVARLDGYLGVVSRY